MEPCLSSLQLFSFANEETTILAEGGEAIVVAAEEIVVGDVTRGEEDEVEIAAVVETVDEAEEGTVRAVEIVAS